MKAPEIKAVIFDMDGCLVDSEPLSLQAIAAEMRDAGLTETTPEDVRDTYLGISLTKIGSDVGKRLGVPFPEDFVDNVETRLFRAYETELRPMKGVVELLEVLDSAGIKIAIATGSSQRRLAKTLEYAGLTSFFQGTAFSADQVANGKPAPDLFLFAAEHLGVATGHCAVLEDSPHGIKGAVVAGMRAVGFTGGEHLSGLKISHTTTLQNAGAVSVIDDLANAFDALLPEYRAKP
jgi:HAD superfamily hydrolase (TIGR01509 family)